MAKRKEMDPKIINRWTGRIIPPLLMGCVGYATYVLVVRLAIEYLLFGNFRNHGAAIALLVIYFILFIPMTIAYFRLLYIVNVDPGIVPLGPGVTPHKKSPSQHRSNGSSRSNGENGDTLGHPYEKSSQVERDMNPDSPGLEKFYSKDVFVCEGDGRPRWCTECGTWKPDRSHHSRDVGRCVRKFDHFCPWVGGVVAENSFKFFLQFVFYTFMYCLFLLIVMAFYLHQQIIRHEGWDRNFIAILALASFFGLFTFGMTCSSTRFALANLSTVENLNGKTIVWQLAVLIPRSHLRQEHLDAENGATANVDYRTITYPLQMPPNPSVPVSAQTDGTHSQESHSEDAQSSPVSKRDAQATRTFAVLHMKKGVSPWDLGMAGNWKAVMGPDFFSWISPLSHRSPCVNHDEGDSDYPPGRWFEQLLADKGFISQNEVRMPRPFLGRRIMEGEPIKMNRLRPVNAEGLPV